jgi:hypothetical protein
MFAASSISQNLEPAGLSDSFDFPLKRDLDPTTNDNEPIWLQTAS